MTERKKETCFACGESFRVMHPCAQCQAYPHGCPKNQIYPSSVEMAQAHPLPLAGDEDVYCASCYVDALGYVPDGVNLDMSLSYKKSPPSQPNYQQADKKSITPDAPSVPTKKKLSQQKLNISIIKPSDVPLFRDDHPKYLLAKELAAGGETRMPDTEKEEILKQLKFDLKRLKSNRPDRWRQDAQAIVEQLQPLEASWRASRDEFRCLTDTYDESLKAMAYYDLHDEYENAIKWEEINKFAKSVIQPYLDAQYKETEEREAIIAGNKLKRKKQQCAPKRAAAAAAAQSDSPARILMKDGAMAKKGDVFKGNTESDRARQRAPKQQKINVTSRTVGATRGKFSGDWDQFMKAKWPGTVDGNTVKGENKDALNTIASQGDADLFDAEDVQPRNTQSEAFCTDRNADRARPENNLVTPEGSLENTSRTSAITQSTIRRLRLNFSDTAEKVVKRDSSTNICPVCNGEKDKSKNVCRTCEEALNTIALEGMDDDDILDDESVEENLGISSVSQNSTAQRQLEVSDTGATNNGKNDDDDDDSSGCLVLTIQIRSHGTSELRQRYSKAKERGEVMEIRSQESTSSANYGISSPCVIMDVSLKRSQNSNPPLSNNQHSSEAPRTGGASSSSTTSLDVTNSRNPNSTSISNSQESEARSTCIDCGATTDQIWMRRCNACYAQNMSKLRESGGGGSQCRMCSKQLDETWKKYCGVCYAAKHRDDQRKESAESSVKRKSGPVSPEAKRSRVQK